MENRDFGAKIRTKFSVSGPRENSGLYKNTANGDLLENVRSDRENVGLSVRRWKSIYIQESMPCRAHKTLTLNHRMIR